MDLPFKLNLFKGNLKIILKKVNRYCKNKYIINAQQKKSLQLSLE